MKPILKIVFIIIPFIASFNVSAQVLGKFGANQSTLNTNAALEVESTSKGVLLPRLTTVQQNAMSLPTDGMLIYNTDSACFVLRRAGIWRSLCAANSGEAWSTLGNNSTTPPTTIGASVGTKNYLGTFDAKNLVLGTNSLTRMIIDQNGNAYGGGNSTTVDPSVTNSFAWGDNNKVFGINSMAIGTTNVDSSMNAFVFGNNNVLGTGLGYTGSNRSNRGTILGGGQNVVTGGETYNSIINGSQNTVSGSCFESIISGYSNTINASQKIVTNGQWNTLNAAHYSAVFGIGNTVSSLYGLMQGQSNTINTSSDFGIALGQSNTIAASHANSMVIGKGMTTTTSAQFAAGFTGGFRFYTNSTSNSSVAVSNVGNVGINTNAPLYKLDIDAQTGASGNPVRFQGLLAGATSDSIISSSSGVLRRLTINQILTNAWNITGNTGTTAGTNFIGTTDNISLTFKTNNVRSGYLGTSADNNVFMGYNAGLTISTGTTNTLLGATADVTTGTFTNATALGYGATVNASNKIRLGNSAVTLVETQGSFVTVSDKRLKTNINDNYIGLNFIKAVRPVQYELKAQKGIVYDGFIAQELDSILQKQGIKSFSGVVKPANTEGGYYTVSYATFVVPLVNAVKELAAESEKLKIKNEKLVADNEQLKTELEKLKKENTALKANVEKNSQDIELIKAALNKKQN